MRLYRISKSMHITDMAGSGGLYSSGRWHAKGTRVMYFSENISLAKLEVLANSAFLPQNMSLLTINIPGEPSIRYVEEYQLPDGWNGYPYLEELHTMTANWINSRSTLILKVPSAQAEHEYNYLVNPTHPLAGNIEVVAVEPVKFDRRLKF